MVEITGVSEKLAASFIGIEFPTKHQKNSPFRHGAITGGL